MAPAAWMRQDEHGEVSSHQQSLVQTVGTKIAAVEGATSKRKVPGQDHDTVSKAAVPWLRKGADRPWLADCDEQTVPYLWLTPAAWDPHPSEVWDPRPV